MANDNSENLIKRTCRELGVTQKELAARMGLAETTVSQWARGINPIPEWAARFMSALTELKRREATIEAVTKAISILQSSQI
ncbi:MAG: helix-turn-helix domain-containing protein [Helicobacteraceae bacterium]|nr:helix-turn-helix domain-containing protein [Helicobacteraceae bacterium]